MSAPRVLIIDDNVAFAENLAEILEAAGYRAVATGTRQSALELAARGFEVALVDVRLPDGDGTQLAPELKAICPSGEVVLLTGFATIESAADAVRAGAYAFLVKPCSTQQLLLTVEQALRQVRLHADREELAHRAHTAEKLAAVGTLTAGLSHEIRNPLNAASLQLTLLDRRIRRLPPGQQQGLLEPLGLIGEEIRRLDHVLEDFLQFARPRELAIRPIELAPLLERVLGFLGAEAEARGVRLESEVPPGLAIEADEDRLRQVLVNLALNAMDAAPRGGWVRVGAHSTGKGRVQLSVCDSGPGVPREIRDRIFEPFYTTKPSGSGLGLPIVHAIVTQHGGKVTLDNDPGGGARFTVELREAIAAPTALPSPAGAR